MTEKPILNGVNLSHLDIQKREKVKLVRKKCLGCYDTFTYSQSKNYDYCQSCEINGSRHVQNKCPECGDGSGLVKFKEQSPRNCKLCYLVRQEQREKPIFTKYA